MDEAGARSTTDQFHDLYADAISDKMFMESCDCQRLGMAEAVQLSVDQLDQAEFWINSQSVNFSSNFSTTYSLFTYSYSLWPVLKMQGGAEIVN